MKSLFNYIWTLKACKKQAHWYAAVTFTCHWQNNGITQLLPAPPMPKPWLPTTWNHKLLFWIFPDQSANCRFKVIAKPAPGSSFCVTG